jgi:hypothetical protein
MSETEFEDRHVTKTQSERFEEWTEAANRHAKLLEEEPNVLEARAVVTPKQVHYTVLFRYNNIPKSFTEDWGLRLVDAWASTAPPWWLRRFISTEWLCRHGFGAPTVCADFVRDVDDAE